MRTRTVSRRRFLRGTLGALAAGLAAPYVVPRYAIGGLGRKTPSDTITRAVIGPGGRGGAFVAKNEEGRPPVTLAVCEVDDHRLARALQQAGSPCEGYLDYREVIDRADIDVVYIATPPHWHALISIHAMEAGKDVYCEKPMTKFIHEGRVVADTERRTGRIFQIGTFGRFGGGRHWRRIIEGNLLGRPLTIRMVGPRPYNWKVRGWSGRTNVPPQPVPPHFHYDMWLGPAPFKPYFGHRTHGSFRGYWDYDGGGYTDMGHHYWDPVHYAIGMDNGGPLEAEAEAPWPAHPDAVGMWGRITYRFPGDITVVCVSGEWGQGEPKDAPFFEGPKGRMSHDGKTDPPGLLDGLRDVPEPPPMEGFDQALWSRKPAGGNAEASHRVASTMHLGNLAIRLGRKIQWDAQKEQVIDDEEANRFVNIPMRAPWHL